VSEIVVETSPAPPLKPEAWIAKGSYVDMTKVFAAEIPDGLVREIGTRALEDKLGLSDAYPRAPKDITPKGKAASTATFNVDFLRQAIDFLAAHSRGRIEVTVASDGPILLEGMWETGDGAPQRIRIAIAEMAEGP
jgi:hypothetical protein